LILQPSSVAHTGIFLQTFKWEYILI